MNSEVNSIYTTFQGEQNAWGIGESVIFLRFSFCHLRCYLATYGKLCDTPEALEHGSGTSMSVDEIIEQLNKESQLVGGVKRICMTGGDPLARPTEFLHELFFKLQKEGYEVSVETSGTLDFTPFLHIYSKVTWVIDYKGSSTGIKKSKNLTHLYEELTQRDIIKFVVANLDDFIEMVKVVGEIKIPAKIVAGVYEGPEATITTIELFGLLKSNALLGKIHLNMQVHKLANKDYFNNPSKYKNT